MHWCIILTKNSLPNSVIAPQSDLSDKRTKPPEKIFVDLSSSNASVIHHLLHGEYSLIKTDHAMSEFVWQKWNYDINKQFYIYKRDQGRLDFFK